MPQSLISALFLNQKEILLLFVKVSHAMLTSGSAYKNRPCIIHTLSSTHCLCTLFPADPRHPMRALDPIRPDPPIHPKPTVHERPVGPLPPKPAVAAKPPLPTPASPAGGAARPSSAPPHSSSAGRVQLRHIHDGRLSDTTAQVTLQSVRNFRGNPAARVPCQCLVNMYLL